MKASDYAIRRAKQLAEREDMPHAVVLNRRSREWVIDLDSAVRGRFRIIATVYPGGSVIEFREGVAA
jgi:hypothetical protein